MAKVFYDKPIRRFVELHCFAFEHIVQDAQIRGGANNGDDKQFVVEKKTLKLIRGSYKAFVAHGIKPSRLRKSSMLSAIPYLAQYWAGLMSHSVQDDARVVLALMEEVGDDDVVPLLEVEGYVAFHQDGMVAELRERLEM